MPVQAKSKWKRTVVGSILKSKDTSKPNYLKVNLFKQETLTLKNGQVLQVESKRTKLNDVARLREEGRLDEEYIQKLEDRANSMPDFVVAEVILVEKE